jgi:hypothetical protein
MKEGETFENFIEFVWINDLAYKACCKTDKEFKVKDIKKCRI